MAFTFPVFCGVRKTNSNEQSNHRPKNILLIQNNVKSRLKSNNEKILKFHKQQKQDTVKSRAVDRSTIQF